MREKMMCIILLLIKLTSCVSGTFVVNVTQTSCQAEENHNITLEWMFTTKPGSSLHSLSIYCELLTDLRASVLFHLHGGVEVPESQDEQFTGRVQCDKDVFREGRLRLHVSRLTTNDSGLYMCEVFTHYGGSAATCWLNVTAAADEPRPQRPTESPQPESPQPESWKMIVLYVGLTAAAALLTLCVILYVAYFRICREKCPLSHTEVHVTDALSPDCNQKDIIGVVLGTEGTPQTWYLDPRVSTANSHSLYFLLYQSAPGLSSTEQAAVRVSLHGIFKNSSFVHLVLLRQAQGFSVAVAHRNNTLQRFSSSSPSED